MFHDKNDLSDARTRKRLPIKDVVKKVHSIDMLTENLEGKLSVAKMDKAFYMKELTSRFTEVQQEIKDLNLILLAIQEFSIVQAKMPLATAKRM